MDVGGSWHTFHSRGAIAERTIMSPLANDLLTQPQLQHLEPTSLTAYHLLSYLITMEAEMNVGKELRRARRERGLTVRSLAQLGGTSPAAISQIENGARGVSVERLNSLLLKTRHRIISIPSIASTVVEAAESIAEFISVEDFQAAYREFISFSDSLKKQSNGVKIALTLSEPESTGSDLYDCALAAITEYWLNKEKLPIPEWVENNYRFLATPAHLKESIYGRKPDPEEVAEEFARRGVIFPEIALASV